MLLTSAQVTLFKSIEDSGDVPIDAYVTVLVGQNESGKTAFLQALHKSCSTESDVKYVVVDDYPRRTLINYERIQETKPATVTVLKYMLQKHEIEAINSAYGFQLLTQLSFSVSHLYNDTRTIGLVLQEKPYIDHILSRAILSAEVAKVAKEAKTVRQLISLLKPLDRNAEEIAFLKAIEDQFDGTPDGWEMLKYQIWKEHLDPGIPKFLYFDDYFLLPGKVNLPQLQQRVVNKTLQDDDKTVLSLIRLAGITLESLTAENGYEHARARLEGISNTITDRIFEYWTQNKNLRVGVTPLSWTGSS